MGEILKILIAILLMIFIIFSFNSITGCQEGGMCANQSSFGGCDCGNMTQTQEPNPPAAEEDPDLT